jgi:hypothetical protein
LTGEKDGHHPRDFLDRVNLEALVRTLKYRCKLTRYSKRHHAVMRHATYVMAGVGDEHTRSQNVKVKALVNLSRRNK